VDDHSTACPSTDTEKDMSDGSVCTPSSCGGAGQACQRDSAVTLGFGSANR
jgi:hypothetical protein